jgi:hypothetical protein
MQKLMRPTAVAANQSWKAWLGSAALLLASGSAASAAVSGQWDFDNGNLNASAGGKALEYADGVGADTQKATSFGTTTSFGIPNIGGTEARVMKFGTNTIPAGFSMPAPATGNGGGGQVNQWTLLLDVLFPAVSNSKFRAIIETDGGLTADAEAFVNTANGFGIGSYGGTVTPDAWHRLAIVTDTAANQISFYINGARVLTRNSGGAAGVDGRWALAAGGFATLFADDNGETAGGFVNSIQLHNTALSKGQILALGGATAAGLPATLPPVPPSIENWIPSGAFASRDTAIGAVINPGDATIQDSSISLTLDGAAVASPTITRPSGMIRVEKTNPGLSLGKHSVVLTFTDSLGGQKKLTNEFTAALFFEDFDSLSLVGNLDEGLASDKAWTNRPPTGWSIDNSKFVAVVINPETNPDADGDGYADEDGVTEWAGWSFANRDWWVQTAGDQRRSEFTLSTGNAAIADPDEWDDRNHVESLFNSVLSTPAISVQGLSPNTVTLAFASSWRPEARDDRGPKFPVDDNNQPINNQTAIISASFDGGAPIQILKWDSIEGSPTFHTDLPNESVLVSIPNPAGARSMVLSFAMLESANDWWWAIDNIAVSAGAAPPTIATQPASIEVAEGAAASLTVAATGDGLTYQWFKGIGSTRTAVSGATTASLALTAAKIENAGYYSVDVKNSVGSLSSGLAKISVLPTTTDRLVLLNEDFEGLALGANVEEGIATGSGGAKPNVWTKTPPAGWSIDDTGVPGVGTDQDGVTEWAGWSFANREWWATTAGDQQRTRFLKGTGTVAIADSDEWDDIAHAAGNMATFVKTKAISLDGAKANSLIVKFDSSWRPEEPQKATVTASFDGGAPVEIVRFESPTTSPNFRPDEVNETVAVRVNNPAGAKSVVLTFGYFDTRNNWWWAFDNLQVLADKAPLFSENFDSLVLGPNVEEGIVTGTGSPKPMTAVWTKTAPAGWTIDDSGVPGLGTATDGVVEWAGWSFADRAWWAATAGDQRRSEFLKGTGTIAIADSDEWDDQPNPESNPDVTKNYRTLLTTRSIDITGQAEGSLYLQFDSSWRDEEPQKINVTASYDGGAASEVLRWESGAASPFFHDDNVNETVKVALKNPAGAKSLKITFGYFDSYNNWWWAIDNLEVSTGPAVAPAPAIAFQFANGQLTLTWVGAGFTLEESASVGTAANWTAVAGITGNSATVPAATGGRFYRLKK